MVIVNLTDVSGKVNCIDPKSAEPVFEEILKHLKANEEVAISFKGANRVISAFLNVAIGKLCNPAVLDQNKFDSLFSCCDATHEQEMKVKQVIKMAKEFYLDPQRLKKVLVGDN